MNNLNVNNNTKIDEEDSKSKRNTFMSNKNTNSDFICRVTGLSLDEVEKLRKGL